MTSAALAAPTSAPSPGLGQKRLGQFFTGPRVARLLAVLANATAAESILDPMVGSGDMLHAASGLGSHARMLAGVDVDPNCIALAQHRKFFGAEPAFVVGSVFAPATIRRLPRRSWDLVLTNPPYVRYQATSRGKGAVPSASQVRADLIESLALTDDADARPVLEHLARGYSGLADLAVPSWLLCSALVRQGGRLAMVVPDTWLTRDYASPIQYLLRRCFDVDVVVRDSSAAWFTDALVRPTLVVATRVAVRATAFSRSSGGYVEACIDRSASDERSVVGAVYADHADPDLAFAATLANGRDSVISVARDGITARWVPFEHGTRELRRRSLGQKWVRPLEVAAAQPRTPTSPAPPLALEEVTRSKKGGFTTLAALGWKAGQGLRTGANDFFYCGLTTTSESRGERRVTSKILGDRTFPVPADALLPSLRAQWELPDGFAITPEIVASGVLLLTGYALPEDIERSAASAGYQALPASLTELVRVAAETQVGFRRIPELSAVRTNVRGAIHDACGSGSERFWYHLPPLAPRHRPELLLPRVNHRHATTYLNARSDAAVDANFTTLWRHHDHVDAPPQHAVLALMNSSWVRASLELIATVLGGGALKLEATHLRRLPLPILDAHEWGALDGIGRRLGSSSRSNAIALINEADDVVMRGGLNLSLRDVEAVRRIARTALESRRG
jgi:N-6 DNA Methylase